MKEKRVTKQQAIRLKKEGFIWETDGYYDNDTNENSLIKYGSNSDWNWYKHYVAAPTLSDTVRWLREVKGWHVYCEPGWDGKRHWGGYATALPTFNMLTTKKFPTHDEALLAGIDAVLDQIEKEL